MTTVWAWRRLITVAALLVTLVSAIIGYTEANTTAPSSMGSGTGHITVTTTAQGRPSMSTASFPAP